MTEEKKSKTKEKEKITTVQDGIFRCEGDLMDVDDPNAYVVSLGDQIRRELGTLEDGHAKKFEEQLEDIMADEENEESRLNTYNTLMGAGLSGNYPLEQIEKVAEIPTLRRIAFLGDDSGIGTPVADHSIHDQCTASNVLVFCFDVFREVTSAIVPELPLEILVIVQVDAILFREVDVSIFIFVGVLFKN